MGVYKSRKCWSESNPLTQPNHLQFGIFFGKVCRHCPGKVRKKVHFFLMITQNKLPGISLWPLAAEKIVPPFLIFLRSGF